MRSPGVPAADLPVHDFPEEDPSGVRIETGEALGLHEMLQSLAVAIEKLSVYEEEARSDELRYLAADICREAEQDYEELRDIVEGAGMAGMLRTAEDGWHDEIRPRLEGRTRAPLKPVQPRTTGRLSDRAMVTDMLECCKQIAVKAVFFATEMSHQSIRRALAELSRKHLDAAFKIYKFMERSGWYPQLQSGESPEQWLTDTHRPPEEAPRRVTRSAVM